MKRIPQVNTKFYPHDLTSQVKYIKNLLVNANLKFKFRVAAGFWYRFTYQDMKCSILFISKVKIKFNLKNKVDFVMTFKFY